MHQERSRYAQHCLVATLCCAAALSWAGDLSRLSDLAAGDVDRNTVWINQTGERNLASVEQGPAAGGALGRHYADIIQVGDDNVATVRQSGELNRVRIRQDGSDFGLNAHGGVVTVTQEGSGNLLDLLQMGSEGNRFSALQRGNNNRIQVGDSNPLALAMQRGSNNRIDLVQNNDGNKFSALQDGNDNVIEFTQNGGNEARVRETGNGNTVIYEQKAGDLKVDVALHGGESWPSGLRVKIN